jgi:hypothetical protein
VPPAAFSAKKWSENSVSGIETLILVVLKLKTETQLVAMYCLVLFYHDLYEVRRAISGSNDYLRDSRRVVVGFSASFMANIPFD